MKKIKDVRDKAMVGNDKDYSLSVSDLKCFQSIRKILYEKLKGM